MTRSKLQQKNIKAKFLACELWVNFVLHFAELHIGSSIKYENTLFGNYFLKCYIGLVKII